MNKFLNWINWCVKTEKVVIEQIEKHRLVLEVLEELATETKNVWDDMLITYIKNKILEKKNIIPYR